MKLNSVCIFTIAIVTAIFLCPQVANGQTDVEIELQDNEEENANEPAIPLNEQLVGFWTTPIVDPWNPIPGRLCCMPDNMTFASVPDTLLLSVTFRFASTNLQCQAISSVKNEAHFVLRPIADEGYPSMWQSQPGDPITYYLSSFIYSHLVGYVATIQFSLGVPYSRDNWGLSNLEGNLRVYSQQPGANCSFYMTEKKSIETTEGPLEASLLVPTPSESSLSGDSGEPNLHQIKTCLIITSVGFGIMSITVMILSALLYVRRKRFLSQKVAIDAGNRFVA